MPVPKRVSVNQRALVDKVLARYPEDFTVLRELLQNADDAGATEVQIEFQTGGHAQDSEGTNSNMNGTNGTIPDLSTTKVPKLVVRNNGNCFKEKDWDRLTTIGNGNDDTQKIGAFGVGFYSVFSVTDSPKVISGGRSLSIFYKDDGDELYIKRDTCIDDKWTTVEMNLKKGIGDVIPKPLDLVRFLVTTMTFMSCLETTSVSFDGEATLKIAKFRKEPESIPIPFDMKSKSKRRTMDIKAVSVATQDITVWIANRALAAGTKRPYGLHSNKNNVLSNSSNFWGTSSAEGEGKAQPAINPSSLSANDHTLTASYFVYSAAVETHPGKELHEGLKHMTKKDPPPNFKFEMVYFSKEQHDAKITGEGVDQLESVFRGPQGLIPRLDGDRKYTSRVFIGQSTAQTTGIGGHLSGLFIPTVERGSIDLTNGHIATWNEELLYVGGFLARLVYDTEMNNISSAWPKDQLMTSQAVSPSSDKAMYAMRYFSFHRSTPDAKVSEILRNAFFDCSDSDDFTVLSSSGIRRVKDTRWYNEDFASFMTIPVLHPKKPDDPPSLIHALPYKYRVREYKYDDMVNELRAKILQDVQVVGLLRWWVSPRDDPNFDKVQAELRKEAKFNIGNPKREVTLSSICKFADSSIWHRWLQPGDPLPPDTIPLSFTGALEQGMITPALGWQPMTVVDWLRYLTSSEVDSSYDIRKNDKYSNRVLGILGSIWLTSPDAKHEAKKFMKDVPWIATNHGPRRASEAYFDQVDIFRDLPVVTADPSKPEILLALNEFGVKKDLKLDELLSKARQRDGWAVEKMVKYLGGLDNLDDIKSEAIFPSEKGGKYRATELYVPHKDFRDLGLPVLKWPKSLPFNNDLLIKLGFLPHPPLEKIIEIAGSDNPKIQHAAFTYLSVNFDKLYEEEYGHFEYQDKTFIPATRDGKECIGAHKDVCYDHSWAVMGFPIVGGSVNKKTISRLMMREDPPAGQVIKTFKERPPKDHDMALKWFSLLSNKQVLSPEDLQQVADIPIVPVGDQHNIRIVRPRECFLDDGKSAHDHHYQQIFTFVNFNEHANKFLEACHVKTKPDCSDIVKMLLKDPFDFFKKIHPEENQALEKYLDELRLIATGYDGLSEEDTSCMKQAKMFVGYRISMSSGADQPAAISEFQLLTASEILIVDCMENRRMFGTSVWLAPEDEKLERLYESVGSEYLGSRIICDVKPNIGSSESPRPDSENVRRTISERLPIFLHGLDKQRLKKASMDIHWEDESSFLVKRCEDLRVEKRLDSKYLVFPEHSEDKFEYPMSAEIATENSLVTLWLREGIQVHAHEVAAALCGLLFKTPKKHDVLCLMTILKTNKEVLRRRGYNVEGIHDTQISVDLENKVKEETSSEQSNDIYHSCDVPFWVRLPDLRKLMPWVKTRGVVKSVEIDELIDETLRQLIKGQASLEEQETRMREYRSASKKATNVGYCAEQKYNELERDNGFSRDDGIAHSMAVWKQRTVQEGIPQNHLSDFATIIHELRGVFGLGDVNINNDTFNIFWDPEDPKLMGFNRNGRIFLNLAHYISKHLHLQSGVAYIEWYHIIVHEMAHVKTPFHDEHHELLVSALVVYFFVSLHEVSAVREYIRCTTSRS